MILSHTRLPVPPFGHNGSFLIVMRLLTTAFPAVPCGTATSGVGPCSETLRTLEGVGCLGGARTRDPLINSQMLLPAELQGNI